MHLLTWPSCRGPLIKFRRRCSGCPSSWHLGSQTGPSLKRGHVTPSLMFTCKTPFPSLLPLLLDPSEYPRFYQLASNARPPSLHIAAPFSMPTLNPAEDFFKRARERSSEIETDNVNDDEVKKELQPGPKKNYNRAVALWHHRRWRMVVAGEW
jgi:hypothetical protein